MTSQGRLDADLLRRAREAYESSFDGEAWFGRCIFLSFYCERGTCTFCFRSVARHKERHAPRARRSLASVLTEALLIRAFGWRIEFLTGGYGSLEDDELVRTVRLVSQALGRKLWVNLGELSPVMLGRLRPYVEGVVSSIETINPSVHERVCPDKPIEPYERMMVQAKALGYRLGFTIIIGIGESRDDFPLLEAFISKHSFERLTIYALRPVRGTPFTQGPSSEEVAWWIAKTRAAFPSIEIIAGSAEYRLEEAALFLRAGANAITKLPATKLFNTPDGERLGVLAQDAGRRWTGTFSHPDPLHAADWESLMDGIDLTGEERESLRRTLEDYLSRMGRRKEEKKVIGGEVSVLPGE